MGQQEIFLSQLLNTMGFLFDQNWFIKFTRRRIRSVLLCLGIETRKPYIIFLTEVYKDDISLVDDYLSDIGYNYLYTSIGVTESKVNLYTITATKTNSHFTEFDDELHKLIRGGGVLSMPGCEVICIHFALRNKNQEIIGETLLQEIESCLLTGKSVFLIGDFNQTREDLQQELSKSGYQAYGTEGVSHKILGIDFLSHDFDHVVLLCRSGEIPAYTPHNTYTWYNSDHAAIYSEVK